MNLSNPFEFIVYFACLWVAVGYVSGLVTGWHELARSYRYRGKAFGAQWKMQSAQMRLLFGLHNMLTVGVDSQGLYLATLWLFRLASPRF